MATKKKTAPNQQKPETPRAPDAAANARVLADVTTEHESISIEHLRPAPWNPRKTFGDLTELKASLVQAGLIHPLLVRPLAGVAGTFEVVCGHRRLAALRELGAAYARCEVRELDDQAAVEIALIENSTRADVPLLEEAESLSTLHEKHKLSAEDLAVKIGKSTSYVYSRLRVATVCPKAKQAIAKGILTPAAALLLARIEDHKDQAEVLERACSDAGGTENAVTVGHVRWAFEGQRRQLRNAPFDTKDVELVAAAGACIACPKRTSGQSDLFGHAKSSEDTCLDRKCWEAKAGAVTRLRVAKAKEHGLTVVQGEKQAATAGITSKYNPTAVDTSRFVRLDDACWEAGSSGKKWRDVLGAEAVTRLGPTLVLLGNEAHEVLPRASALKALVKPGTKAAKESDKEKARRAAEKAKQALDRAFMDELRDGVVEDAKEELTEAVGALLVALALDHAGSDALQAACKRRNLKTGEGGYAPERWQKALRAHAARIVPLEQNVAFALELLWPVGLHELALKRAKDAAKLVGIDVAQVREAARARLIADKEKPKVKRGSSVGGRVGSSLDNVADADADDAGIEEAAQ